MKLQAILWDVDGTLAETERDGHRVAFNMAFKENGLDWDWSEELYGQLLAVTGGKERIKHYLKTVNTTWKYDGDLESLVKSLHLRKNELYADLIKQGKVVLRPGVLRLLNEAREKGVRMAIATTTSPENVENLVSGTIGQEAMGWFELIAAGDIVPAKKPAADIYHYALEKMKLDAQDCIAIEDSYNGITAARGANLTTVITRSVYTLDDDFDGAAVVLDQLGESGEQCDIISGSPLSDPIVTIGALNSLLENA